MFRSLGLSSDVLAMRGLSVFEDHGNHVVQRTPSEPDYWSGNQIIFRHWSGDAASDLSTFRTAFPDATHVSLAWDLPGPGAPTLRAAFPDPSFEVDHDDVLTLTGPMADALPPPGILIRTLAGPSDSGKLLDLEVSIGAELGYAPGPHRAFMAPRLANREAQIALGHGAWFGAFEGDSLVASMGILHDDRIARYQSVLTAKPQRKRGICMAMLHYVRHWVQRRAPSAIPVIVADPEGPAGRIYRRMGFTLSERLVDLQKRGY